MNFEDYEDEEICNTGHAKQDNIVPFSFYNNDNGDLSEDSEEEEDQTGYEEDCGNDHGKELVDVDDDKYPTETEKRRERRHELSARRREGDRRRAQGLPRNYLLVDEYTGAPYGQGVGSWRKEIKLLSQDLDPAIGNINKQPDEALQKIGEWIQHTWEYSRLVKWEIVKEAIARGVSLRWSELWKRIRSNQPKPELLSDRSWQSLKRQLETPAMMKKFENCSKANACRQNFGRTGPSGEVGMQERLRKKFKRSPSPTEIRMEMARPKGYEGRSKRHQQGDNVMHGSGKPAMIESSGRNTDKCRVGSDDSHAEDYSPAERREEEYRKEDGVNVGILGSLPVVVSSEVLALSTEQVSQHPAFIKMMDRLDALERRSNLFSLPTDVAGEQVNPVETEEERPQQLQVEEEVC